MRERDRRRRCFVQTADDVIKGLALIGEIFAYFFHISSFSLIKTSRDCTDKLDEFVKNPF